MTDHDGSSRAYRSTETSSTRPGSAVHRVGDRCCASRRTAIRPRVGHRRRTPHAVLPGRRRPLRRHRHRHQPRPLRRLFDATLAAVAHEPHRQVADVPTRAHTQGSKLIDRQQKPTVSLDYRATDAVRSGFCVADGGGATDHDNGRYRVARPGLMTRSRSRRRHGLRGRQLAQHSGEPVFSGFVGRRPGQGLSLMRWWATRGGSGRPPSMVHLVRIRRSPGAADWSATSPTPCRGCRR